MAECSWTTSHKWIQAVVRVSSLDSENPFARPMELMMMVYPAVIIILAATVLVLPFILPPMLVDCVAWMLRARPDDYEGWCYYGRLLAHRGRYAEAAYAFEKALTLKPDYTEAWEKLGDSLTVMGKLEDAAEAYKNAGIWENDSGVA